MQKVIGRREDKNCFLRVKALLSTWLYTDPCGPERDLDIGRGYGAQPYRLIKSVQPSYGLRSQEIVLSSLFGGLSVVLFDLCNLRSLAASRHTDKMAVEHDITVVSSDHSMDLEAQTEKKPAVTVTAVETGRPMLGRRKTTGSLDVTDIVDKAEVLAYDGEEDALTKIGNFFYKIHSASVITRYALYILPVAALLAIPLVLTMTTYSDARADGIKLAGLFIWIEIIWLALWVCKLFAQACPIVFQAACGMISTGIRKYSLVLKALEIPLSLLFWSIVSFATTDVIYVYDKGVYNTGKGGAWIKTLKMVWKAGIIVAAIFLVEKTIMQLISINYHRKQFGEQCCYGRTVESKLIMCRPQDPREQEAHSTSRSPLRCLPTSLP